MKPVAIDALYATFTPAVGDAPPDMRREFGHFDVFTVGGPSAGAAHRPPQHFNRQAFYKISLTQGSGCLEFADQRQQVGPYFLFMATPSLHYRWTPTTAQTGCFCIFTDEFLQPARGGVLVAELPLFRPGAHPIITLSEAEYQAVAAILQKMTQEIASTYAYKYDLLRTYLVELIHLVQKLQPARAPARPPAATRLAAQFTELLERQFAPAASAAASPPRLLTAKDYADQLAVHIVHLNRVLKEATGHTTTTLIGNRLAHEAKRLLKQTTHNVSEVADYLGFADVAHFCTFFKRHTGLTPGDFRQ